MQETTINISGMSCGHCVAAVKRALSRVQGVEVKEVKVGSAVLRFDPATVPLDTVKRAIADAGYEPQP